jgi:hypothetical protein
MPYQPLPEWGPGQPVDHRRLNAWLRRCILDVTVGPGLRLTRVGQSLNVALGDLPPAGRGSIVKLVKITGNASGGGKYTGTLWDTPTANIPATGDLTEAEVGVAGTAIRIVNTREVGESTHDLASASFLPLIFVGYFLRTAEDGVPVYAIDGRQSELCPDP